MSSFSQGAAYATTLPPHAAWPGSYCMYMTRCADEPGVPVTGPQELGPDGQVMWARACCGEMGRPPHVGGSKTVAHVCGLASEWYPAMG